jgi:phage terminase large subunit
VAGVSAIVTPAVERVTIPAGGLQLYRHQRETIAARRAGWKRRIANDHRQSGKDQGGLVDIAEAAIHAPGVYAYIAPTFSMVDRIAWRGIRATDGLPYLSCIPPQLILEKNEADMRLTLATTEPGKHSVIHFLSGDSAERLRGLPLRGVVVTEYAQFQGSEVLDTVLPALNRSGGWLLVLSTPLGIGNHYHQLWQMAQASPDWWTATRTIHDTVDHEGRPLIAPAIIEAELRDGQRREWLDQEYACKFVVGLVASIFGDVLSTCESSGRILDLPQRMDLPGVVAFDLGVNDSTVAIWALENGPWLDVVDVEAWQNLALPAIIQRVQAKGYPLREWYGPHDLAQRDLGAVGVAGQALTRLDVAARLGVRFTVARKLPVSEGLDMVRRLFSRLRFDTKRCARLLEALGQYQRQWDPTAKVYAEKPLHNWCSDYADALRTLAVAYHERPRRTGPREKTRGFYDFHHFMKTGEVR